MEGTKNINKKLLITIFTFLFLIRFIYSVYSQATSAQNNAVSSLESNSIIQGIISSSANGYSTLAQYLANFLSINGVPTYVWTIITFLMATLFFIGIYTFLFEIFVQKIQRNGISETETIRKAKILFIFTLSLFSAIAIGFAIPFLFNLYGLILLILISIALFFFGRATISYGRSFHYAAKSFEANIEKDLVNAEKELKRVKKDLSEQDIRYLEEGREKIHNDIENIRNEFTNVENKFQNTLSSLELEYKAFINDFINRCKQYFKNLQLSKKQINTKDGFIRNLEQKRDNMNRSEILNNKKSPKDLYNEILGDINSLQNFDDSYKSKLKNLLYHSYGSIFGSQRHNRIFRNMQDTKNEYEKVRGLLINFYGFEDAFKRNIELRFRHFFNAPDSKKYEISILSALDKSKNEIERIKNLVNERINFLEELLH